MESPENPGRFTVLVEQNEEWQLQHRYLPQHTMLDTAAGSPEKDLLPAA